MRSTKWIAAIGALVLAGTLILIAMGGGARSAREPGLEIPSPAGEMAPATVGERDLRAQLDPDTPAVRAESSPLLTPPDGFLRTEAGALAAAVSYLEATEEAVTLAPVDAGAAQGDMATADFADEFAADTERRMSELVAAVPGGIRLRLAPIEARSVPDGADWLVSIWYVQALTLVGDAVVDDWRTANYRMRWQDDTWKIASFESNRGPMPGRGTQPASATPTQFEALLSGFSDAGLS